MKKERRKETHKTESTDREGIAWAGAKPRGKVAHSGGTPDPSPEETSEEAVCQSRRRAAYLGNRKRAS